MKIIWTHLGPHGIKNLKIKSMLFLNILLKYYNIFLYFWVNWTCMSKKMLGANLAPLGKMHNSQNNIDPKSDKYLFLSQEEKS